MQVNRFPIVRELVRNRFFWEPVTSSRPYKGRTGTGSITKKGEKMSIDTDRIKQEIDLRQLAGQFTTLKGRGRSQSGPCPKCGGTDRFVVYQDKFICRVCHQEAYGDVIEFAAWLNDYDFRQAVAWLTNDNPPTTEAYAPGRTTPRPPPLLKPPTELWQQRAAAFVAYSREQLFEPAGRAGLDYLLARGLTIETIKAAGLGFNPKDIYDPAKKWGVTDRPSIWLPGPGVVIPWYIDGAVHRVNIRLLEPRTINGSLTKYIGPAGWGGANPLYNADATTPRKPVLMVEGELCALTANQEAGDIITAVATGSKDGAQAGRWIARLAGMPLVLLAFDAEPGKGDEAARQWGELLPKNSRRWRPILKDVNDMHRAGISVRDWIGAALPEPSNPFVVVTWPADIPAVVLPRYNRLADGRLRTEYRTKAEFADNVYTLAMLKDAVDLGGVAVGLS
jgi:DNA primase